MISRRDLMKASLAGAAVSVLNGEFNTVLGAKGKRPNFLWLSAEDFSPHLGCYGDRWARTPAIDQFAKEGVRFTRAFTVHGVCAPVRSSIISGMYPSSLGSCAMRCKADLPELPVCFTEALRQAGYYCTNESKEDYNFDTPPSVWDHSGRGAHYRNRAAGQPFFAVFNFVGTHESALWDSADFENTRPKTLSKEDYQNPDAMVVPPLYPDCRLVRQDLARLYERITEFDHFVRDKLRELESEQLAEDTIVFIWSDHGDGLPRFKRCLYDTGTHVPLLVRMPKHFRIDGQAIENTTDDRLINLLQLGPTVLNLAGIQPLQRMQGRPFLGPNLSKPNAYIFGARDRVDELFDLVRAVRDGRYRFIRNLNPWVPYLGYVEYAERCNTLKAMRALHAEGKLAPPAAKWMVDRRPAEELYDLEADPYEMHNLADDPRYHNIKQRLSRALEEWIVESRDTGLLPEPILRRRSKEAGSAYAVLRGPHGERLTRRLLGLAVRASNPEPADKPVFVEAAGDQDAAIRYWGVVGLGRLSETDMGAIERAAADADTSVCIAAARAMFWHNTHATAIETLRRVLLNEKDEHVIFFAMHTLRMQGDETADALREAIEQAAESEVNESGVKKLIQQLQKKQ